MFHFSDRTDRQGYETKSVKDRLLQRRQPWQKVPTKLPTLVEIVNPQPRAMEVYARLLNWIHRAAVASRAGRQKPPFTTEDGADIFPDVEEKWWLTDVQKFADLEKPHAMHDAEDGPAGVSSGDEAAVAAEEIMELEDDDPHSGSDQGSSADDAHGLEADDSYTYQHWVDPLMVSQAQTTSIKPQTRSAIRDRAGDGKEDADHTTAMLSTSTAAKEIPC